MSERKAFGRGQMTRGANSQPAVMMMPPHIRATFVPNPPIKFLPPIKKPKKPPMTGVFQWFDQFETSPPPKRILQPTPQTKKLEARKKRQEEMIKKLEPIVEEYRKFQRECGGEFRGMNCYNTLFVGRLAYEVTERKLLREMEAFGPVKDITVVSDRDGKSRGYAFVEYENEEDLKRAYRAADGIRIDGRAIVVDVERGHTVPTWLPRRLGGGLGGTRLGGKDKNVTASGRYDPSRPETPRPPPLPHNTMMDGPPPPMGMGRGRMPPPKPGYGAPPPPDNHGHRGGVGRGVYGGPPRGRGGGVGDRRRPRSRSRSPERARYAPRPRY